MHITRVEYDPAKAAANVRKHGVWLADGEGVLFDPLALTRNDANSLGEQRFVPLGLGSAGQLLVVVFTERAGRACLISARRATRRERAQYEA